MEVVGDLRANNRKMIKTIMTIMIIMMTKNNKEIVHIIKNKKLILIIKAKINLKNNNKLNYLNLLHNLVKFKAKLKETKWIERKL